MFSFVSVLLLLSLTRFTISDIPPFNNSEEYQFGEYGAYPRQRFLSDPEVIGPVANTIVPPQDGVSPNKLITWSPHGDRVPTHGPQLLDAETLSVVYQGPMFDEDNFGITLQSCNGSDYLVWWSGTNIDGRAAGYFYILNSTYHNVWNVSSVGLKMADAHDIFITPDCHAIITVNEPKPYELEDFHLTDNSWILDSYFQEIDLATNELIFQWRASDYIDPHDSLWMPYIKGWDAGWQGVNKQDAWDFFHINSVEKDRLGNFLISSRHMNSLYYIDGVTGVVLWTLGGKQNDFKDLNDGHATDFAWQHHARWANEDLTLISVFDDRNCRYVKSADPISRGALISLDFTAMTASLAANYRAPSHIEAFRKGGMQVLENRNVLLGYGNEPAWTEFAPNGTILWDVHMGPVMAGYDRETADNYRSYKFNWTGTPHWGPKLALGPKVNATNMLKGGALWQEDVPDDTVYLSWNGATKLQRWMVFRAQHPLELDSMANLFLTVNKTGFETGVYIGVNTTRFLRAVAVDKDDEILGATPILDVQNATTYATAAELLKTHRSEWKGVAQKVGIDAAVAAVLQDDSLTALKEEWNALRLKNSPKTGVFGWSALVLIVVFAILAWFGSKQLKHAFDKKYAGKEYRNISDEEEGVSGASEIFRTPVSENKNEKRRKDFS